MQQELKESVGTLLAHIIKVDKCDVEKEAPLFCDINPKYALGIIHLLQSISTWAFTNNHRLTFGLTCPSEMPLGCKFFANTHSTSTIANFGNSIA